MLSRGHGGHPAQSLVTDNHHRLQQVLEGAHIKLAPVAPDVLGGSGRAMLQSLATGVTDLRGLAALAKGRLRVQRAAVVAALAGVVGDHPRFLLGMPLRRLEALETELAHLDAEVAQRTRPQPAVLTAVATISGVGRRIGANRAAVAVAHSIAVIRHHISRTRQPYADLGHHYFEQRDQAALTRPAVHQLERLGRTVTLQVAETGYLQSNDGHGAVPRYAGERAGVRAALYPGAIHYPVHTSPVPSWPGIGILST